MQQTVATVSYQRVFVKNAVIATYMIAANEVVKAQNRQTYLKHEESLSKALQVAWGVIVLKYGVHPVICHQSFQDAMLKIYGYLSCVHSKLFNLILN